MPATTETVIRPFAVEIDRVNEIVTIQGIRYTFGLFDVLGFGATGARFEIGERHDGVVTLLSLSPEKARA